MSQFVNRSGGQGGQPCKKVLASVDRLHLDLWDLPNVSCSLFHISSNCEHLADVMLRKCHCYDEDVFLQPAGNMFDRCLHLLSSLLPASTFQTINSKRNKEAADREEGELSQTFKKFLGRSALDGQTKPHIFMCILPPLYHIFIHN